MSSDAVGLLKVSLQANTAEFATGVDQASHKLKGFAKDVDGMMAPFGRLSGALAGLGASLGVTSIAAFVKSSIDDMGRLADMAKQTGASVEFLSSIKIVAKLAGTSLDEVAGSIQKLSVNLGNAKLKGGDQAKLFKQLGIDPASTTDVGEALVTLAKRLDAMPDKMKAIAIARELLGKGVSMPFIEELANAGTLLSKLTTEQVRQAKQFEDDMIRLKGGAGQLGIALATAVLPPMNEVLKFSLDVKKEWGLIAGLMVGIGGGSALKLLGVELDPLKRAAKETTEAINGLIGAKRRLREEESVRANVSDDLGPIGRWMRDRKVDSAASDAQAAKQRLRVSLANQAKLEKDKTESDYRDYMRTKGVRDLPNGALGEKKADQFTPLMRSVSEHIQQLSADAASTDRLTEAQKFLIKTIGDVDGGYTKLTEKEKTLLGARLEALVVADQQNQATEARRKALEQEAKAVEEYFREEEKMQALVSDYSISTRVAEERLRQQAEMIGMSERQKQIIEATRKVEDDAAAARARAFDIKDPRLYQEAIDGISASMEVQKKRIAETTGAVYDYSISWEAGAKTALTEYLDAAENMAAQTRNLMEDVFGGMEDALVDFVKTGKVDFKSLSDSIISDLIRIQARQAIAGATGGSNGWLSKLFSGSASGSGSSGSTIDWSTYETPTWHTGGVIGAESSAEMRTVLASMFSGAKRYHAGGLLAGEVPAILKAGEGVFTPAQMKALGVQQSGGGGVINVSVNVDASGTKAQGDDSKSSELGRRIGSAVRAVIVEEKRPGGILAKAA